LKFFVYLTFSSKTCPTCRSSATLTNIVKLFFDFDDNKGNLNLDEILKTNDDLMENFRLEREKTAKLRVDLQMTEAQLRQVTDCKKVLERQKQIDDMTLAGLKTIKDGSANEIIKLNKLVHTLKLDLLAEKQLRRTLQQKLHGLDPKDDNFNTGSVNLDEESTSSMETNTPWSVSSPIVPFWKLHSEPKPVEPKPYVIPQKIQKAMIKESPKTSEKISFLRQYRPIKQTSPKPAPFQFNPPASSSSSDTQPSTSSGSALNNTHKRTFGEGASFQNPITSGASTSVKTSCTLFNVSSPNLPSFITSASSSSSSPSPSPAFSFTQNSLNYRDRVPSQESTPVSSRQAVDIGPKSSDR
jgi:hypothetical protein